MAEQPGSLVSDLISAQPQRVDQAEIRAVIFDLDDTLWPMLPLIKHAELALSHWLTANAPTIAARTGTVEMRALRGRLQPTDARFQYDLWALRHAMLTELLSEVDADRERVAQLADAGMAVFANARNQVSLFEDVLPALTEMGQYWRLGTISNGFADLNEIGLAQHFQVSLAAHRFGCAKPDARIFLAACAALEVEPGQAIYVGDDLLADVQGARQAGLRSVWLNRAGIVAQHEADMECRDLKELARWLHQ